MINQWFGDNADWIAATCVAWGCDEPPGTGGVCEKHYRQHRFLTTGRVVETQNGCWRWSGAINPTGYGSVHQKGGREDAHRVAHKLWNGPIPEGLYVLHSDEFCQSPDGAGRACVNPDHLTAGTPAENMKHMIEAGNANYSGRVRYSAFVKDTALECMGVKPIDWCLGGDIRINCTDPEAMTVRECADELGIAMPTLVAWRGEHWEQHGKPARVVPDDNHDLFA